MDFPIPANDDAAKSIALIMDVVVNAIKEGLSERKVEKDKSEEEAAAPKAKAKEEAQEATSGND